MGYFQRREEAGKALHRAQQRTCCSDGYPRIDGPRTNGSFDPSLNEELLFRSLFTD